MLQTATPLPASIPACAPGHHPHLVRTAGAPDGHRLGAPCPVLWHIECTRCQCATVPTPSRALAESRWTDPAGHHRLPLSQVGAARRAVLAAPRVA